MNNSVPFFRPQIAEPEIDEVVATLRSGWLTTGKRVQVFEKNFAAAVGAPYAIGLNSCTAALHLGVEALGLKAGEIVLVPTMTFAATAEVVRYHQAIPMLVDCDPITGNMDMNDALRKINSANHGTMHQNGKGRNGNGFKGNGRNGNGQNGNGRNGSYKLKSKVVGIMPVHIGGVMMDMKAVREFAAAHNLWIVEDAAHSFPAAWRAHEADAWEYCGQMKGVERRVVCFSFYANKTITTGEGGMAVTGDYELAQRMRLMSLHGLSHDAWDRYSAGGSWDYQIIAPGFKYNLTDIAAAIGIHQLARAEEMRRERELIAHHYLEAFNDTNEIELPPQLSNRLHAWHLFPIRLCLDQLEIDRNQFIVELKQAGVGCSVHFRPLHLHPYHQETFGWRAEDFPAATSLWQRLISLPIFPGMQSAEIEKVVETVKTLCQRYSKRSTIAPDKELFGYSDYPVPKALVVASSE